MTFTKESIVNQVIIPGDVESIIDMLNDEELKRYAYFVCKEMDNLQDRIAELNKLYKKLINNMPM